jgi:polyphosphate glucokinase
VGTDSDALFSAATGQSVHMLNDADAAGIAEMTFGAGKGERGVVMLLTFGTGIGSAIFSEGVLVPNTELGHLEFGGLEAEHWASAKVKEDEKLGWKDWAKRVNAYLGYLEALFSPDLFIIGGGVSKKSEKFFPKLKTKAPVKAAELRNEAGIVGAALEAARLL